MGPNIESQANASPHKLLSPLTNFVDTSLSLSKCHPTIERFHVVENVNVPIAHQNEALRCVSEKLKPQQAYEAELITDIDTNSYWNWPTEESVEQFDDVLSLSNIESNLVQEAQKRSGTESIQVTLHDDYWMESTQPIEYEGTYSSSQHYEQSQESYWDWQSFDNKKESEIKKILADETARTIVHDSLMDIKLIHSSDNRESKHVNSRKYANDGYWTWTSTLDGSNQCDVPDPIDAYWEWNTEEPKKSSPLESLMEYEAIRQLLCVENIEAKIKNQIPRSGETKLSSDDYWGWTESLGDQYWEESGQNAIINAMSYWDW